jgi:hypothetical protein
MATGNDNRKLPEKGQVTWLANQGSEQALVQANSGGAENRARRNLDGEKKMTATTY